MLQIDFPETSMPTLFLLAMALFSGDISGSEMCEGFPNDIEPDMRIVESDLSAAKAETAAAALLEMIRDDRVDGDDMQGALNRKKIVEGYLLRRHALIVREERGEESVEARESLAVFCIWMGREGFWYD